MKGHTRSPGIRRAVQRAARLGFSVDFVEFVLGCPAVIPPQGHCDRAARRIQVGTRDLAQPGMPLCGRDKLLAILEHEIEHAEGKDRATDRPEFGLFCGGMLGAAALCTPDHAIEDRPWRRYRVWLHSVPGMYAQYDGHVDVSTQETDSDEIFRAAVRQLRRTSFPERSADCWRLERFETIG